jgi:hypothetical protein
MWVDLLFGEADTHEGVSGDGRRGPGEQSAEVTMVFGNCLSLAEAIS